MLGGSLGRIRPSNAGLTGPESLFAFTGGGRDGVLLLDVLDGLFLQSVHQPSVQERLQLRLVHLLVLLAVRQGCLLFLVDQLQAFKRVQAGRGGGGVFVSEEKNTDCGSSS